MSLSMQVQIGVATHLKNPTDFYFGSFCSSAAQFGGYGAEPLLIAGIFGSLVGIQLTLSAATQQQGGDNGEQG